MGLKQLGMRLVTIAQSREAKQRQQTFDLCIIDSTDEPLAPWQFLAHLGLDIKGDGEMLALRLCLYGSIADSTKYVL